MGWLETIKENRDLIDPNHDIGHNIKEWETIIDAAEAMDNSIDYWKAEYHIVEKEMVRLQAEVKELKEYKSMYEGLCK